MRQRRLIAHRLGVKLFSDAARNPAADVSKPGSTGKECDEVDEYQSQPLFADSDTVSEGGISGFVFQAESCHCNETNIILRPRKRTARSRLMRMQPTWILLRNLQRILIFPRLLHSDFQDGPSTTCQIPTL